ncbi:type II toxin-antitoxin system RelE/ParE family toxin [Alloalcanivorax xenomutans]|uniref:type II toxin-antitoxin system RelE/ParE family toxin n=1 Tax=Alloalcanivorax xenomutans TaxID=1094342 RepID=UPI0003B86D87|nr:type II toxin-antitoxin system RelE/ParE family toxin [Alloalcanivorax xenomutans]ERS13136.1 hypothetical protein Q668_16120 [Alcanivorax sp. PN-3]CUR46491.1 FIG022160: hypothetical toxin [Alloalcanivorax xenomutans]
MIYKPQSVLEIRQTDVFKRWRARLKDQQALGLIASRLDRLAYGHAGDEKAVGDGVSELRIHHGPGYRIYFAKSDSHLIVLLCGGSKRSQQRDIKLARRLAREWRKAWMH